jgi:hypothetical protein
MKSMSTQQWLIVALLLASFFGYLEWAWQNSAWFYEIEWEALKGLFRANPNSLHPFIILPILGQCCLLVYLIKPRMKRLLVFALIGLLPLFVFVAFVGTMGHNAEILLSTLPFIILSVIVWIRR